MTNFLNLDDDIHELIVKELHANLLNSHRRSLKTLGELSLVCRSITRHTRKILFKTFYLGEAQLGPNLSWAHAFKQHFEHSVVVSMIKCVVVRTFKGLSDEATTEDKQVTLELMTTDVFSSAEHLVLHQMGNNEFDREVTARLSRGTWTSLQVEGSMFGGTLLGSFSSLDFLQIRRHALDESRCLIVESMKKIKLRTLISEGPLGLQLLAEDSPVHVSLLNTLHLEFATLDAWEPVVEAINRVSSTLTHLSISFEGCTASEYNHALGFHTIFPQTLRELTLKVDGESRCLRWLSRLMKVPGRRGNNAHLTIVISWDSTYETDWKQLTEVLQTKTPFHLARVVIHFVNGQTEEKTTVLENMGFLPDDTHLVAKVIEVRPPHWELRNRENGRALPQAELLPMHRLRPL